MTKDTLRIIYMGTPDFAVEPLKKLVEGGYNIVGVITMPDKPIGRHQNELSMSPVKKYAISRNLKVLQPVKLKDPQFLEDLQSLKADLQIVVAFRMLPEIVWNMPPLGTFNLHAALLPQYRGAAPLNWAIINGDTQTGITTFFLDEDIDTGKIIQRVPVPILDTDNVEDVHDKLMYLGSDLVVETVDNITYALGNAWFVDQVKRVANANEELDALKEVSLKEIAVVDQRFQKEIAQAIPDDSTRQIKLTAYQPNELKYEVNSAKGGVVVFSEIYYPGWRSLIDGQEVAHGRADYVLRAMQVPAGKHEIVFQFDPTSLHVTETVAYTSLVLLLLLALGLIGMQIRQSRQAHPAVKE